MIYASYLVKFNTNFILDLSESKAHFFHPLKDDHIKSYQLHLLSGSYSGALDYELNSFHRFGHRIDSMILVAAIR